MRKKSSLYILGKEVTVQSMARKKSATATAETPVLTFDEIVKRLIERGKKRGSLTYEEITASFDTIEEINPERLDELFEEFASLGIEVVEEAKDEKPERSEADIANEADTAIGLSLDDPVRMYLKEIGRVNLLSMDDERRLAMAIEAGEMEALKKRLRSHGSCHCR